MTISSKANRITSKYTPHIVNTNTQKNKPIKINLPPNNEKTGPVLTNRTSPVDTATARKVKKNVSKTGSDSLYNRVCTTENLDTGILVISGVVIAAAIGKWASEVGTLTASKIIATNLIAFLKPGVTVVGFALKTVMLHAVVPVVTGLITISLPIISTIVVTIITVLVVLHVLNQMIQKLEEQMKAGVETAKALPGKLLEQIPGYEFISSILGYNKAEEPKEEPKISSKKKISPKRAPRMYTQEDILRNTIFMTE